MTAPVIVITAAGAKVAVRVIPAQPIDRDRAFAAYPPARTYAAGLADTLCAQIDDRIARDTGGRA